MKSLVLLMVLAAILFDAVVAPPVTEKKNTEEDEVPRDEQFKEMGIEYNRYLTQVVEALESDPDFRKKLENASSSDIQSGKIAEELDFVSHNIRTKLDEVKRVELERLRKLSRKVYEYENEVDARHMKVPDIGHLDHENPDTFEIADLKKLISKTSEDLSQADKQRKEEFKNYEMEKEYEKQKKLNELDDEKRKKYEQELEEQKTKHKKHEALHHPGSKQQLEEVWEKQDHMENQEFDPKAFFFMHDLDGNGGWDEAEVKALFLKELDKMYEAGAPEDDMRERAEEMERMREHVFREADLNRDNLISFEEFLQQTKKPEFERDQGWQPLDEQQVYTQDEYHEFERRRQEEIQRLIQEGKLQPPPVYHHPQQQNYYPPPPPPQGHNQVPYQQQPQAYQQQQVYQQQQHFQQQQQNNLKQQQEYHQQNPQHYQQPQYQQNNVPQQQQYQPNQQQQYQPNIQQPQNVQQPNQQQQQNSHSQFQQQNVQQTNQQQQQQYQPNQQQYQPNIQQPQNVQQPNQQQQQNSQYQQQNVQQPNQQQQYQPNQQQPSQNIQQPNQQQQQTNQQQENSHSQNQQQSQPNNPVVSNNIQDTGKLPPPPLPAKPNSIPEGPK